MLSLVVLVNVAAVLSYNGKTHNPQTHLELVVIYRDSKYFPDGNASRSHGNAIDVPPSICFFRDTAKYSPNNITANIKTVKPFRKRTNSCYVNVN